MPSRPATGRRRAASSPTSTSCPGRRCSGRGLEPGRGVRARRDLPPEPRCRPHRTRRRPRPPVGWGARPHPDAADGTAGEVADRLGAHPDVIVQLGGRLSDHELWRRIGGARAVLLAYRWSTHSGLLQRGARPGHPGARTGRRRPVRARRPAAGSRRRRGLDPSRRRRPTAPRHRPSRPRAPRGRRAHRALYVELVA